MLVVVGERARIEVVRGGIEVGGIEGGVEFVEILQQPYRRV